MKKILFILIFLLFAGTAVAGEYSGSATGAELDYMSGVTSAVQDQLDAITTILGTTGATDVAIIDGISDSGTLTAAELLYVDGVTSAIQGQLDARCLESVFGTGLNADDLVLTGTDLELAAEIPHTDVNETITGDWDFSADPLDDTDIVDALTISGGTVNNSVIGGSTAAAITGTTVKANTSFILEGGANDTTLVAGSPTEAVSYTLPAADGIGGQYLTTDGNGALSWGDPSGSGDITAVGDAASGAAFTADGTGNVLYFEGTTANGFEIALTGANPGADVVVTIPAATGTLLLANGDGSALTSVDAATGDSATEFFDAGAIETNYGGTGADLSAVTGIMGINAGTYVDVDTAAELETYAGLGAFANEYLDDPDAATMLATLGIDSAANLESSLSLGAYASDILGATDSDDLVTLLGLVAGDIPDLSATYEAVDAEILRADTADTIGATIGWADGQAAFFGGTNAAYDWGVVYDEASDDRLEFTHTAGAGADVYFDLNDNAADSTYTIINSDATYEANLVVEGDITYSGSLVYGGSGDQTIAMNPIASWLPSGSTPMIAFEGASAPYSLKLYNGSSEVSVMDSSSSVTWTGTSHDFTGVTNFSLPTAAADAPGEISISTGNQFKWHDGAKVVTIDTTNTNDNYVLKYDNATATFNLEADADSGSNPEWQAVVDPTSDATITHDAGEETTFDYTGNFTTGAQFLVRQHTGDPTGGVLAEFRAADSSITVLEVGDGTNVWTVSPAGQLSNAGTATINLAAASDLLVAGGQLAFDDIAAAAANIGANAFTVNSVEIVGSDGEVNAAAIEDAFLANTGDIGTGTYDFGGADDLEVPNGANPTVDTQGQIAVDSDDDTVRFYTDAVFSIPGVISGPPVVVKDPDADSDYAIFRAPYNITIVAVHYLSEGGTSWTGQLQEADADGDSGADTQAADTAASAGTTTNVTSFSNATIDAGDWVMLKTTSISGTPTSVSVSFEYTVDAVD